MKSIACRGLVASCLGLATLACSPAATAGGASDDDVALQTAITSHTDRLIVKYKAGTVAASRANSQAMARAHEAANRAGVQMSYLRTNAFGAHVMKLDRLLEVGEVQALASEVARADLDIEFAEPDHRVHAMYTPSDPGYSLQWHYQDPVGGINAPLAWDKTVGGGMLVAVIDTGYRPHADLAANIIGGYDFISDTFNANDGNGRDSSPLDPGDWVSANACGGTHPARTYSTWHGTHVAGTVAAVTNNGLGVVGVAYGAKVVPVRVLGRCGGYDSDIADAITWASGGSVSGVPTNPYPARVLNMSLGGPHSCNSTWQAAINGARSRGAVVVVAAGNDSTDASGHEPANCAGVIAVAATNSGGARASFSNYGAVVDLAAPGTSVYSTANSGSTTPGVDTYEYKAGTSMATPHVAGVAALMLSWNGTLTPDQVESKLKSSARAFPGSCVQCGAGIVDANAALIAGGFGGAGKFAFVSMSRTSPGSSGDIATIVIKNTGGQAITSIGYDCSGLSWHGYGNAPYSIAPGASFGFQCQAAASGAYPPPVFTVRGNASNSPFTPPL